MFSLGSKTHVNETNFTVYNIKLILQFHLMFIIYLVFWRQTAVQWYLDIQSALTTVFRYKESHTLTSDYTSYVCLFASKHFCLISKHF